MKTKDRNMLKSRYLSLEKSSVNKAKLSIKATKYCVENLIAKSIRASNIAVLIPSVILDTVHLQGFEVHCACQVDISSSSSKDWFEIFLEFIDVTEAELDAMLTESEDDNLLFDQIDCVLQAIKSVRFNCPQCPIQMLQTHFQTKGLELDILENIPIFFPAFKQKLYKEFQCSFPGYCPLLQYVNIKIFRWQVMSIWEFLVNTQIDENSCGNNK